MKTLVKPYGLKNYGFLMSDNGHNFYQPIQSKQNYLEQISGINLKSTKHKIGTSIANKHINIWNEHDAKKRKKAIEELYTEDFLFTDPNFSIIGHEMYNKHITNSQADTPKVHYLIEDKSIIVERDIVSFRWRLINQTGISVLSGLDAITLKSNNKIESLDVYLDKK